MEETNPTDQPPRNKGGNPILKRYKETGTLPEGYYLDGKGRLRKEDKAEPTARVEGDFDRLKVMRYVLNNPRSLDRTEGEKAMRAYLEKSPGQFMETFDELVRREEEKSRASVGEEPPVERTEEDQELYRLLGELLDRVASKAAQPHRL